MFFNDVIKRYSLNHKYLINEVIIEGGNIINSNNDYIFNKNSIIKHNSLSWNTIESKIKSVFDKKINGNYYFVNVQELTGDDTDGHIDNLVRFKDDNTILYMATNDKKHPDYKTLKEFIQLRQWTLLGTIILKESEWKQVLKHVKYTGDYDLVNAKNLSLVSKK